MILISNCRIITMSSAEECIDNGYLIIEGKQIAEIGTGDPPLRDFKETIDGTGKVALPGFVNAHTHASMTMLRGYADDLPLMIWLQEKIWPLESKLQEEDYYWGAMLAISEMIKSGTTCFADMYFNMDQVAKAVNEAGIRACLSRGMIGIGTGEDAKLAFDQSRELAKDWHGKDDGRINIMLGPHAPYTCPPDYLRQVISLSDEIGIGIQIHLAETENEVRNSYEAYGRTPVEFMEYLGLFSRPVLAAHCVHLTTNEIDILAKNDVGVAHCAESNMKLASGIAPVSDMLTAGIKVGLGTDGASSNNNLDMIEEMRACSFLHKVNKMDATVLPAYQTLEMATVNGACALGLADIGLLKTGNKADIILVNLEQPHLTPVYNVVSNLVYSARGADVDTVFVDGKLLMKNRQLKTIDEKRVLREIQHRVERLKDNK
ncbi:MAG: amidohydrolase [Chitinophagales bacterium]